MANFPSAHDIGDQVIVLNNHFGVVTGVSFIEGKVTYEVELDMGGEPLRNVDSTFVEPAFEDDDEDIDELVGPSGFIVTFEPFPRVPVGRSCDDPLCAVCRSF